jgi:DNA processing protein
VSACAACLRRTALIGLLSTRISTELANRRATRQLLALDDEELIRTLAGTLTGAARRLVREFDPRVAIERIDAAALHPLCRHARLYPRQLRDLGDPPAVLHSTAPGERIAQLSSRPAAAIVGTRRASAYGLEVAATIGRGLGAAGVTVVSGLALGIDAAAHRGALEAGGATVAVLGCGADVAYPRANRSLYERIRANGAVVAELPPGQRPARWTFPARNRIMAALGQVTVVVEAAGRSGSLITVGFAQDLGRDVCAVPGRVTARMAEGANQLIVDGAHPIRGAGDVLDLMLGAGAWDAGSVPGERAEPLDARLERVLEAVEAGDSLDEAAGRARMPASEVRGALGRLELLGLVRRDGLGAYERMAR